ncbi:uncharacterized protein LOC131595352 [Vicia villosa]|uniref:uncharacterized protein LOC131595352 n=1 Tax=Vicia villosa TaxID=3911 RepID=UPI00273B810A|nr:uncharacterized protein LOC131595352 [Vicia villosa]XP_058723671.1 uncharacterized protein LOC131595352 [Vicia villosa]XP_058723672.1 uncharacterized protein LOC131595352 [Vicia villosa]
MGCLSSKLIIARSISYHEERNQRSNSIPLLEDLIISTSGNSDRYLSLLCTANKVSNKLHSKSLSSNTTSKFSIEDESSEVIDKLEQENLSGFEEKDDLGSKDVVGNRSFHTVEEYDDMVNRIWLKESQIVQPIEFHNEEDDDDASIIKMEIQDQDSCIEKMQPLWLNKNEEVFQSHKTRMLEKGNKRKAIANRLESLRIPSDVEAPAIGESPAIGSLKEWLPADGIYSPGSYVTPKFGSYPSTNIRNENESNEDSIFSPELVSAFEQCMQKLEAEEENILKQILETVEEEEIDEGIMQT